DVIIADSGAYSLRFVAATSCSARCPFGLAATIGGDIYTIASQTNSLYKPGSMTPTFDDFYNPQQITLDSFGNVLVPLANVDEVRLVAATSCSSACPDGLQSTVAGGVYVIAGNETSGFGGDGAPAISAELSYPISVATDPFGDILISDHGNARIRMVAAQDCTSGCPYGLVSTIAGDIYSVVGNGTAGYSGDNGPAIDSEIQSPSGIAVDSSGNLYIADSGNNRVRMVATQSCSSNCPVELASTVANDIYTVTGNGRPGYLGDDGPALNAELYGAASVGLDHSGDLLVADSSNDRLRMVADSSCSANCPYGLASTTTGDIYTVVGNGTASFSGDGGPAVASQIDQPYDVATDSHGDVIIDDSYNYRIRMVAAASCSANCPYGLESTIAGDIYTVAGNGITAFAGDGGPAVDAEIAYSRSLTVDSQGNIVIAETGDGRIRIVASSTCNAGCPYGLSSTILGDIYTVAGSGNYGSLQSSSNDVTALSGDIDQATSVVTDASGNLFIGTNATVVLMVANSSCSSGCPLGLTSTTAHYMYIVAGEYYTLSCPPTCSLSPTQTGVPATSTSINQSTGLAVDPGGDLAIAAYFNTYLVANSNCSGSCPYGLASMARGYIYNVAGNGEPSGGGTNPFTSGALATSTGVISLGIATNTQGDLITAGPSVALVAYHSCSSSCPAGLASTIAGDAYLVAGSLTSYGGALAGFSGDGGPAISAELNGPQGVTFDPNGKILIADTYNNRIRKVFPAAVPAVTSVSPISGPLSGGTTVSISGQGFTGASGVGFGTTPAASFTVLSDTQINAISPTGIAGVNDITITTLGGTSATSAADRFTYVSTAPVPIVSSISPSAGPASGGTTVTISGTNFTGASSVEFGAIGATSYIVISPTQIQAIAPPTLGGLVDITVRTAGGISATSGADQFDFVISPPSVNSISPIYGPYFGGTPVAILGSGFTGASQVEFGSNAASSFTVVSDTKMTAVAPAGTGSVDVRVVNAGGSSPVSSLDRFTFEPVPSITGLSINQASSAGGGTLIISGLAFSATSAVSFGSTPATSFQVLSDTQISVVIPPGTGTVDVSITTP
ncbi:MAG TPA: IPT/TIG domain-containing protein, partial [Acidimicrobiales bacterium]|nr:IPT/TIG domain-containing protein [Acidimicrobiales bacterium]